ncbi:MAG: hypothetical protein ACLPTJ_09485 [Solirubrobacteraceae bacterium]
MLGRKIAQAGARPGKMIGYYDEPDEDGSVGVHVAFEIGDQAVRRPSVTELQMPVAK